MQLRLNPNLEIQVAPITESHLGVVVDDFLLNPEELIDYACEQADAFEMLERAYPGVVLPVDDRLLEPLYQFIRKELSRIFAFCRGGAQFHTQFSLATLQPEEFTWIQRLCHSDPRLTPDRANYAALLYLFDQPEMGGTGFYRWKDPEFWREMTALQQDDPDAGLDALRQRFQMFREPPCYMTDSNEAADLLQVVQARYNRLLFYSGEIPHSAYIRDPSLLSPDPANGRLTLNCFVSALPKA